MDPPRNRKQRRAAAIAASGSDSPSIPLAHPPRDKPKNKAKGEKTLYDIIAERQNELDDTKGMPAGPGPGTQFMTIDPSTGKISGADVSNILGEKSNSRIEEISDDEREESKGEETQLEGESTQVEEHPIPPIIDTLLLSFPLTTLHLTLAYLAAHQYAEEIVLPTLFRESAFLAFPLLTLLIHLAHGHIISLGRAKNGDSETASLFPLSREKLSISFLRRLLFPPTLKTLAFLSLALVLGDRLMTITNESPYYAVMKRAPAIGTMWIWSILELPFGAAALGALGPLAWGVWGKDHVIF